MNVTIYPSRLKGSIQPPASKSLAQRHILCASLSKAGQSTINGFSRCEDADAALRAAEAFGARYQLDGSTLKINGFTRRPTRFTLDCKDSAAVFRFAEPIAAALGIGASFVLSNQLQRRVDSSRMGVIRAGDFSVADVTSSQTVSGLLFALPLLEGNSRIVWKTPPPSLPYIEMTLAVCKRFGIQTKYDPKNGVEIPGSQQYHACSAMLEADASAAAYYAVIGAGLSPLRITGIPDVSLQGDAQIFSILNRCGALVQQDENEIALSPKTLRCFSTDITNTPDLAPPLALLACLCQGISTIQGIHRLVNKESDRIRSILQTLTSLGGQIMQKENALMIRGVPYLKGNCTVDSQNDHRIALLAVMAATYANAPVTITHASCIQKSYPNFLNDFQKLGGKINVYY